MIGGPDFRQRVISEEHELGAFGRGEGEDLRDEIDVNVVGIDAESDVSFLWDEVKDDGLWETNGMMSGLSGNVFVQVSVGVA